jgi:hypothetical protein
MMIYGATGVFGRPFFEGLLQRNDFVSLMLLLSRL